MGNLLTRHGISLERRDEHHTYAARHDELDEPVMLTWDEVRRSSLPHDVLIVARVLDRIAVIRATADPNDGLPLCQHVLDRGEN